MVYGVYVTPIAAGVEQEDACLSCATPYVRSSLTHECLPLVEFRLGEDITDAQVRDGGLNELPTIPTIQ